MPHIYIPEVYISQDDYNMIQDNNVPIDAFVAARIRNEEMFVYIQETDCTYKRARNYEWCAELESRIVSNDLSEIPDKRSTICDI
tara:strand:+ start:221 stop:475 length:255 start_codon:yes stop_codon:yes gene_type:complete